MAKTEKKNKEIRARKGGDRIKALIVKPRFTEKATTLAEKNNCYTFDVDTASHKQEIEKALELLYGITPKSVRIVKKAPGKGAVRGRIVHIKGYKKAYVYLKKGETLKLM